MIGHGVLLPPDIAAAVMVMAVGLIGATIAAPFVVWCAASVGLVLGAAILTKTTLMVLYPVLCIWIPGRWLQGNEGWRRVGWIKEILVMSVAMWFVINSGYGWEGFGTRLGDFEFISSRLNGNDVRTVQPGNVFEGTMMGFVPVVFPKNLILGIDTQYRDFEINFFYPYLLGRWHREGFFTFYFWYFVLKLPIGFLALVGIGGIAVVFRLIEMRDRSMLVLMTLMGSILFVFLSWRTDLNYCQRYAIVCLPMLLLYAAAASLMFQAKFDRVVLWLLIGTTVGIGVWKSTHALSYYNGLVGGPEGGRYCLHGNATDWGQDAIRIGGWCASHPERRPLAVATVGYPTSLKAFGVEADSLRFEIDLQVSWKEPVRGKKVSPVGWHIVSFVHLLDPRSPYHALLHQTPTETLGWTHQVFFVDDQQAARLSGRSETSLPGVFP